MATNFFKKILSGFIEKLPIPNGKKQINSKTYLFEISHWEIKKIKDLDIFFLYLPLIFPYDTYLCLADGYYSSELKSYIDAYHSNEPLPQLHSEFSECDKIPINDNTMRILMELANHHATPEIAMHLCVCSKTVRLLEWYDIPLDPISLSIEIPEEAIRRFCTAIGTKYHLVK